MMPSGLRKIPASNIALASMAFAVGAVAGNSEDLLKFLESLFSNQIISPESVRQMTDFLKCTDPDIPAQVGYGLGLRQLEIGGVLLIGHTGTTPGFGAAAFYCPEKGYFITLTGNKSRLDQVEIIRGITERLNEVYSGE